MLASLVVVWVLVGISGSTHHDVRPVMFPDTEIGEARQENTEKEKTEEYVAAESSSVTVYEVSAYTIAADETGNGNGITASGAVCTPYYTAACNDLPFGTLIEIDGHIWEVQDRMAYSGCIDLCMPTKAECFEWGRQTREVIIYD